MYKNIIIWIIIYTYALHPGEVGRHAGEDGGFPDGVATSSGHKAGESMDYKPATDQTVQRTTTIALQQENMRLVLTSYLLSDL